MFSIYTRDDPEDVNNEVYNQYLDILEKKIKEIGLFKDQAIEDVNLYKTHTQMNHKRKNCPLSLGIDLFNSEGAINIQKLMAMENEEKEDTAPGKLNFDEDIISSEDL